MENRKNVIVLIVSFLIFIGCIVFINSLGENYETETKTQTYIVTFDSDGGSKVASQSVMESFSVTIPENPTKKGYIFTGWYYNGTLYDFNSIVTENITLKAYWEKESSSTKYYKVKFDSKNDSEIKEQTVASKSILSKPEDPQKEGYNFLGWYYNNTLYNFNSPVTEDMTLEAKWIKTEEFKVTFDSDGGSKVASQTVKAGETLKKVENPTKKGYIFTGWYYNDALYDFNTPVTKDITLLAKWLKESTKVYTVKFNSNGGSTVPNQTIEEGKKATKPANPTKDGYKFDGWYLNNKEYNFSSEVISNITLEAKWTKTYKVTFNTNGGTSVATQTVEEGKKVTKPANPTRNGYTFLGWYQNKREYNFSNKIDGYDITLSALWAPKLNYTKSTSGKWLFLNNPEAISPNGTVDKSLADYDAGNKLLYQGYINGNSEIYFEHSIGREYGNSLYFALKFYNPNSTSTTLKINSCGGENNWDLFRIWKQYYDGSCSIANKTYTIPSKGYIMIYLSNNNFVVKSDKNLSGVSKLPVSALDGVLNVTASNSLQVSEMVFRDINKIDSATYNGNSTDSYNGSARVYSGHYNALPQVYNNMTYDIYNDTPKGYLPISYNNVSGKTYISKDDGNLDWVTNSNGGIINTTTWKAEKLETHNVSDFINLQVPTSANSYITMGPFDTYKEVRNVIHSTSGKSIVGWNYNWANWGVHYNENITIVNHTSQNQTVSFELASLEDSTVVSYYNGVLKTFPNVSSGTVWTETIPANSQKTMKAIVTLGGSSNGVIIKRLYLR